MALRGPCRASSMRWSATVEPAPAVRRRSAFAPTARAAVVRVAVPLAEVDDAVCAAAADPAGSALLIALGVALVPVDRRGAHAVAVAARLTEVGAPHGGGRPGRALAPATATTSSPELGRTLDKLAASLSSTLRELRAERDCWPASSRHARGRARARRQAAHRADEPGAARDAARCRATIGKPLARGGAQRRAAATARARPRAGRAAPGEIEIGRLKPRRLLARVAR